MDPDSTFRMMLEAYREQDFDTAAQLANTLLSWLRKGGFAPKVSVLGGGEILELTLEQSNRPIAYAVANEIFIRANSALETG